MPSYSYWVHALANPQGNLNMQQMGGQKKTIVTCGLEPALNGCPKSCQVPGTSCKLQVLGIGLYNIALYITNLMHLSTTISIMI